MRRALPLLTVILLGAAITLWQYHAGIARCGTIDGGILIGITLPVLYAAFKPEKKRP